MPAYRPAHRHSQSGWEFAAAASSRARCMRDRAVMRKSQGEQNGIWALPTLADTAEQSGNRRNDSLARMGT